MQFTRLRLLGFKSFVDPTELIIAPGLTGIVGPNGCGKSNLLEALRWVMGETRASVMRGEGMEDVIFAGSGKRPARNHAEVMLTLDNRSRRAPAGFNDADILEVVRRITRDAGSAYRANGREARARDVQMLFADASTGAQSPSLVRQGQISELINARPKARRRVLEEAAGISGLYQRRHEAELKLRATETNLARVSDVLEGLETQLATLSRQAKQAARYREIAEALRRMETMLLCRLWRDADEDRQRAEAVLNATVVTAGRTQYDASEAARLRSEAEEAIPRLREEDSIAAAVLQRLLLERDRNQAEVQAALRRLTALEAQLRQLDADREREAALDTDAEAMVERLERDAAALTVESEGHEARLTAVRDKAAQAGGWLGSVEAEFEAKAEAAARLLAEHQAAARNLDTARKVSDDLARALAQAEAALATVAAERERAAEALVKAAEVASDAADRAETAEENLGIAEDTVADAREADRTTRAALAEAEGAAKALVAEVAGLRRLLRRPDDAKARMLDEVNVSPGYEEALGAALADDLDHPASVAGTGWQTLPAFPEAAAFPEGCECLASRVDAPPALTRRLAAIAVVAREDGGRLRGFLTPGQRIVSREGDLWRWDGLTIEAGAAPSAAALRLRQRNLLAEVEVKRADAEESARVAREEQARRAEGLATAVARETAARAARKVAEQSAAEASRALGKAGLADETLSARLGALRDARERRARDIEEAKLVLGEATRAFESLADPVEAKAAVEAERLKVEAARLAMLTHRAEADEVERAGQARARRLTEIAREIESWQTRRASATGRLASLDRRVADTVAELEGVREEPIALRERLEELSEAIEEAQGRRVAAGDALAAAEEQLRERDSTARRMERAAGEAREARARAEALAEAARARARAEAERLEAETEASIADLLSTLGLELVTLPPAQDLDIEVTRLRRARDGMGAVNLRAEEDARDIQAEFELLSGERADLEEAIKKLRLGIAGLNREGRGRLLAAFEEMNRNFAALFQHLFGGGEANLVLVESDDPLEAGLEIMCQPPGKKLATLSLLSGGEQTLTALSLIFAVFLANPSPICVLDEVDAPLDDANVTRFCDLLDEMIARTETRFLVITHHAVTMGRMDRLFGVTMAEPGVSQLVSVDLAKAEGLVEAG